MGSEGYPTPSSFEEESRDNAGFTGLHDTNMFDENEDRSNGDKYDLATGRPYRNDHESFEDLGLYVDELDEDDLYADEEDIEAAALDRLIKRFGISEEDVETGLVQRAMRRRVGKPYSS